MPPRVAGLGADGDDTYFVNNIRSAMLENLVLDVQVETISIAKGSISAAADFLYL